MDTHITADGKAKFVDSTTATDPALRRQSTDDDKWRFAETDGQALPSPGPQLTVPQMIVETLAASNSAKAPAALSTIREAEV